MEKMDEMKMHAEKVKDLISKLNEALREAEKAGLSVTLSERPKEALVSGAERITVSFCVKLIV